MEIHRYSHIYIYIYMHTKLSGPFYMHVFIFVYMPLYAHTYVCTFQTINECISVHVYAYRSISNQLICGVPHEIKSDRLLKLAE